MRSRGAGVAITMVATLVGVLGVRVVEAEAQTRPTPSRPYVPPGMRAPTRPAEKDEAFELEARRAQARNDLTRTMADAGDRGRLLILIWKTQEFDPMVWESPAITSWVERNAVVFDAGLIGPRQSLGINEQRLGSFEMFLRGKRLTNVMALQSGPRMGEERIGRGVNQNSRVASYASAVMTHGALQRALREALQKDSLFRKAHEERLKEAGFAPGRWLFENIDGQLEAVEEAPAGANVDFVLARLALARQAKLDKNTKLAGALMTWVIERAERFEPSFAAARLLVVMPEMRTLGDFDTSVRARATALGGAAYLRLTDQRSRVDAKSVVDFEISARMARELGDFLLVLDQLANFFDDTSNTFSGDVVVARYASDRLHTEAKRDPREVYRWMKSAAGSLDAPGPPQLVADERERYVASKRWVFALEACRAHLGFLEMGDAALADEVVRFAAGVLPAPTLELDVRRWATCVALASGKANEKHRVLITEASTRGEADPLLKRLNAELGVEPAPAKAPEGTDAGGGNGSGTGPAPGR